MIQGPRFIIVLGTASSKLELGEGLLGPGRLGHLQGVVLHSLAQGPGVKSVQMYYILLLPVLVGANSSM